MAVLHTIGGRFEAAVRFVKSGLNRRLLAWFLLFSLVPLLVTNAVGYQRSVDIVERLVENELATIATVQAQHVRDRADHLRLLLQAIAAGNEFLAAGAVRSEGGRPGPMGSVADKAAVQRHLEQKLADLQGFDALFLFAPDGRVIAFAGDEGRVHPELPNEPLGDFAASHQRAGQRIEPEFRVVVPVLGRQRGPVAYLAATMLAENSRDFPQIPPQLAGHVETFIVDQYGRPLWASHPRPTTDYTVPLSSPLIGMPGGSYAHYRDRQGTLVLATITTVPGYPWRFVAEMPESDAFGKLRELRILALLLEAVFIVLLFATAWFVARDIVAPLRRLVDATRRVAAGDLSVRVATRDHDELGELTHSFNEMTAALADTTARVKELHQREIERASQLATVGELASGIAHEIKNPVVGIASGLDLVRRRVGPDGTLMPIMDEMTRQLARIQLALQELLTYARPATLSPAPVSGSAIVQRAIRLVQPRAEQAGVTLLASGDAGLRDVMADEEMLRQAVVNLLMNALEATPAGGRITVATRDAGGEFELEIADTGRGIAAADLDNVFKPFFTTRHQGTGLGLSITREIVQRHGGRIWLHSRPGSGTRVLVHLPFHSTAAEAPAPLPVAEVV